MNRSVAGSVKDCVEERAVDPAGGKDPAAVKLGRKGGLKGGLARAAKLSAQERSEAARKAAVARWAKERD